MDFDALLTRFFGTADIDTLAPERIVAGLDRLRLQFGFEKDKEQRFGLWCLMYMLGSAPEADEVFEAEDDRAAAEAFMTEIDAEIDADED